MYCTKCGTELGDSYSFCTHCGNNMSSINSTPGLMGNPTLEDVNHILDENRNARIASIRTLQEKTNMNLKEATNLVDSTLSKRKNDASKRSAFNHDSADFIKSGNLFVDNFVSSPASVTWKGQNTLLNNKLRLEPIQEVWSVKGDRILKYKQNIFHDGLGEHKEITAADKSTLTYSVNQQVKKWESRWKAECDKKNLEQQKAANITDAEQRTREAEMRLAKVENILLDSLGVDNKINWESLIQTDEFPVSKPKKPQEPKYMALPEAPDRNALTFQPKTTIMTSLFKAAKKKESVKADSLYKTAYDTWQWDFSHATEKNSTLKTKYDQEQKTYSEEMSEWEQLKDKFIKEQNAHNNQIIELKEKYYASDISTIIEFCSLVIRLSSLPDFMEKDFEVDYNPNSKILIIDYKLPIIENFPNIKEIKYISSSNEQKVINQKPEFMERLFDDTVYRLILRLIHEEFEADEINALDAISFNGWVDFLNKATGNREDACIASIQVKKEEFLSIDLRNVDPKACFKKLKGIGSSKLASMTPVQPILQFDKNDKRFISSYAVANTLDSSTNLAAIPWEDFEHLIRELFEQEFSGNGGEVKVTQASRDGGVDAVAFDPDPIRGGKIVIQAKRYTNTVSVSAVRDLFGAVMNEGATKGILVTTADYGPDAYSFAKGKPLTLLNGGNLLHLLEKHGHKAKIDLREAKAINNQLGS